MSSTLQQFVLLGVITLVAGLLFFWSDRRSPTSRALALCLTVIGMTLLLVPFERHGRAWLAGASGVGETVAIVAGIEWARRVGLTAAARPGRIASVLFRVAQGLAVLFGAMRLGYLLIAPEAATTDRDGLIALRGYEWAIFAPVLGGAALLAGIALIVLLVARTDPAESIRLRAFVFAAPFLLAGLVVGRAWVPLVLVIGLMIFLAGTVRYLIVQAQRAQDLDRFLSPAVARLVKLRGIDEVLRRERREISVVVCDLRGFSAYARDHDSAAVVGLLERYYRAVGDVAHRHGATIKDHAGDGVVILVGAPMAHADHAERAARCALELVARVRALLAEQGAGLGIGAGVASGEVTVGAIRGSGRLEYVAVGAAVNLAARLCEQAADGEVLVDAAIRAAIGARYGSTPRRLPQLKGFGDRVDAYALQVA
ncbi:adenylate/guanylate cyclase domain-containing protein [Sinimarinibacterium thermocellulolyticum]|uniref:Adenylate/guanylate cyclase domain-containing protein n=1 Tax=Sinimarinibacterium thermocellulolyticum TaxID=3170016 RepID=A0ABV2A6W6_9GAMM